MQSYIGSLLADAAYLNLNSNSFINGEVTTAGADLRDWSESDRVFFNENFTITNQEFDASGFSGCLIIAKKDIISNGKIIMSAGESSISYRGTEINIDLLTDFQMAVSAGASLIDGINNIIKNIELDQIDDLEMTILLDKMVSFSSGSFPSLIADQRQAALEYFENISTNTPNEKINIYGHSLGGYLANYVTITGTNYQNVEKTITFNAPGFNNYQIKIMEIIQKLENLKNTTGIENYAPEIQDRLQKIINASDQVFTPESLNKLHSIYSTTGPEFTTNDKLGMFHPELRIPLYTDNAGMVSNHFVRYLREALCVYDSLICLMPSGNTVQNYEYITKIIEGFTKDFGLDAGFKAINESLKHIAKFLGIPSSQGIDVLNFVNSLGLNERSQYKLKKTSELSVSDSKSSDGNAVIYSLINYVPFSILGSESINEELYNPENYTNNNLEERFEFFNQLMNLSKSQRTAVSSSITQFKDYKIFFGDDMGSDIVYIDTYKKIMYTNDISLLFDGDATIVNGNLKTIYFKGDSPLTVNSLNNIVHDHYGSDHITLNRGETSLDLSYGNDTINIDSGAGATIKDLTIKDDGLGDLFIFNGGNDGDFIKGTKYTDKIIGYEGDDNLFGDDGNDIMMGDEGDDFIFGENGDDTLNGNDGDDYLMGGAGSNALNGGNGNDTLNAYNTLNEYHDIRGDYLSGGSGVNNLFGTGYGDTYIYSDGVDTIHESDNHFGEDYIDKLIFTSDTQAGDVLLYNILDNLVITINGLEKIFVIDYYNNNYSYLDEIQFTNIISGEKIIWNTQYILDYTISKKDGITTGTMGDDNLMGDDTNEKLYGNDGNDTIRGGKGDDIIYGGNGNDALYGEDGNDIIYGENGDDKLYGDAGDDIIYGGDGNDTINGGIGDDQLNGDAGNDIIFGGVGIDTISGGSDDDQLNGDAGNDLIYGGEGLDTINGGVDNDIIYGDNGDDKLYGDAGNDTIFGGEGNDTINGNIGDDNLNGNNGNDIINGGDGNDIINGGNDNDTLNGDAGNDVIYGGSGIDIIYGGIGNDELHGDEGDDTITGGLGNDIIYGDDGNDTITISGTVTTEMDKIYGGNGSDTISNAINNTYIRGGNDDDKIFTSGENVDIEGENGNDIIYMSTGSGYLRGGEGSDTFINNGNQSSTNYTIEGGTGDDTINMTRGNHNIIYRQGDGNDKIIINGTNVVSQTDSIRIHGYSKSVITSENLFLLDNNKSLKLQLSSTDSINLVNFLTSTTSIINLNSFQFDDGILTSEDLIKIFTNFKGTASNDNFNDTPFTDVFDMTGGGIDNVSLKSGFDTVYGGDLYTNIDIYSANNIINSGSGDDKLSLKGHYANTFNLKNFNNGADQIWIDSSSRSSKTTVNIQSSIHISDMKLNVNSYFYTFSWNDNSSINFMKDYLNNQIILNSNGVAITDLETLDLIGNNDGNYLKALSGRDQKIYGHGGRDTLRGNSGDDTIYGGTGDDNLDGDLGDDKIHGEEGGDTINDIYGSNRIWGGDGDDTINTGAGNDTIYGGNGVDTINAGSGIDTIYGGDGDDKIYGGSGYFYGEDGNDTYNVGTGYISDSLGFNKIIIGADYKTTFDITSNGNGFNVIINGVHTITYNGEINEIERVSMQPSGYESKTYLIGAEINKLFDLQAALTHEIENDNSAQKINELKSQMNTLWTTNT